MQDNRVLYYFRYFHLAHEARGPRDEHRLASIELTNLTQMILVIILPTHDVLLTTVIAETLLRMIIKFLGLYDSRRSDYQTNKMLTT